MEVQHFQPQSMFPQCVAPFLVSTNMTNNMRPNWFVRTASGFAREALNTVGYSSYTSGCLSHALQVRGMRTCDHSHTVSCCKIVTSLLLFAIILQNVAITLIPEWLFMSTFFIRKLQNVARLHGV